MKTGPKQHRVRESGNLTQAARPRQIHGLLFSPTNFDLIRLNPGKSGLKFLKNCPDTPAYLIFPRSTFRALRLTIVPPNPTTSQLKNKNALPPPPLSPFALVKSVF